MNWLYSLLRLRCPKHRLVAEIVTFQAETSIYVRCARCHVTVYDFPNISVAYRNAAGEHPAESVEFFTTADLSEFDALLRDYTHAVSNAALGLGDNPHIRQRIRHYVGSLTQKSA